MKFCLVMINSIQLIKSDIHANIVTKKFRIMVTLRHTIQFGDMHGNSVTNNFARPYTLLNTVQKQQFEGPEIRCCWSRNH
jgi:hypothetical protein